MRSARDGGRDPSPDIREGLDHSAELVAAETDELAIGRTRGRRSALRIIDEADLAKERAVRHRPHEATAALDVDGARHDDVEGIGWFTLAHELGAGGSGRLDRQRPDRLEAARVEVREDRKSREDVGPGHDRDEHIRP